MKILLATDGSEFSHAAVEKCCEFIREPAEPSVRVIAVYEPQVPMAAEPFAISADYYQRLDELARERAAKAANDAADLMRRCAGGLREEIVTLVELGRPSEQIIAAAAGWPADLIVVGSHGRGFWSRLALGSVSSEVVHHAPCSVLVVRPEK